MGDFCFMLVCKIILGKRGFSKKKKKQMSLLFLFYVVFINTLALRGHAGKTIYSDFQSLAVPTSSYCN